MEQRELFYEGICYRLYLFVMKILSAQAMKTVTLGGRSSHYSSSSTELMIAQRGFGTIPDKVVLPAEKNIPSKNSNIDGNELRDLLDAPKKMVSINDKVEEIILLSEKITKSFHESNSQDQHQHPILLPSILKVAFNVDVVKQQGEKYTG